MGFSIWVVVTQNVQLCINNVANTFSLVLQSSNVISLMLYLSRKYKNLIFEFDHFKFRVMYLSIKNRCDVLNKGGLRVYENCVWNFSCKVHKINALFCCQGWFYNFLYTTTCIMNVIFPVPSLKAKNFTIALLAF